MTKYSFKFKLGLVLEYLAGAGGYVYLSKKYGLPNHAQLQQWVTNYRAYGEQGLLRSRNNKEYSVQFKRNAIELYLTTERSYREVALELGMTNPSLLSRWVREFRSEGLAGLSRPKGRPTNMKNRKSKKETKKKTVLPPEGKEAERIKELEDQVLSLQIQNAYLKELRRLQTKEKQSQTNESPESSSDSAPNSH